MERKKAVEENRETDFRLESSPVEGVPLHHREARVSRFHCCKGKFRLFGHYVHAQFILLGVVEFLAVALATFLVLKIAAPMLPEGSHQVPVHEILLATGFLTLGMMAMGLYDTRQRESLAGVVFRLLASWVLASFLLWGWYQIDYSNLWDLPRHLVFGATALATLGITRILFYRYLDGRVMLRRTLVLGTGKRASYIDRLRRKSDQRGFKLVGYVAPKSCQPIEVDPQKIINVGRAFCDYSIRNEVDEIVIAVDDRRQKLPIDELLDCRMSGIEVTDAIDFFEREQALIHLDLLQPGWLIHADGFKRNLIHDITKRGFDLAVSLCLLALSAPISLLVALAIRLEDRGPVF